MNSFEHYAIKGGLSGRARLTLLTRIFAPTTGRLLDEAGVAPGNACLDAGCGGGDVARDLAARVGDNGKVVGIDMDRAKLTIARKEAEAAGLAIDYRTADILEPLSEPYDVVYMRFLLSHLTSPETALRHAGEALRPGGALIVEDVDFSGHFSWPESATLKRYVELYTSVVRKRGGDANIGPRLPAMLTAAGFPDIHISVVTPAAMNDKLKLLNPVTMEAIADAVVADGIAAEGEVRRLVENLYEEAHDPTILTSLPRIVQCWARKPAQTL
jgi:SAM-dependent methyltransferase